MRKVDVIIIGAGGGLKLRPVSDFGKRVVVIEQEKPGGTCLNRGCIPSKMLIHAADVASEIREAHRFNIEVDKNFKPDFQSLVTRVNDFIDEESDGIFSSYKKMENVELYKGRAKFVGDRIIEVNGEQLTAEYVFIATGARPRIPKVDGLAGLPYWTSKEALRNRVLPKSMVVVGGGYIAMELGYFYAAMGTEVDFLVRGEVLGQIDSEVAEEFRRVFDANHNVHTWTNVERVQYKNDMFVVTASNSEGGRREFEAERLLIAAGVFPNSDDLGLENTGIEVDENGFIKVDNHLRTGVEGVYALGDVVGNFMFRHSVNFEGEYLLRTLFTHPSDEPIIYPPMPYAVFSRPQIGGVGKTEDSLRAGKVEYIKGLNYYKNSAMGDALRSDHGFVKLLFEKKTQKLIGAHIIGPEASDMIHILVAYMNMGAGLGDLLRTIYAHPALPENIRNAARKAKAEFEALS